MCFVQSFADLKMMFEPRPPLEFKPPIVKRKMPTYRGIAGYTDLFEQTPPAPRPPFEPPKEKAARKKKEKQEAHERQIQEAVEKWDPAADPKATEYVCLFFVTIFAARLDM